MPWNIIQPQKGIKYQYIYNMGLPWWLRGKETACQCKRCKRWGFDPWVRKIPWRRTWQPTPVSLPGESHEQRSMAGYSPWDCKVRHDWCDWACTHMAIYLQEKYFTSVSNMTEKDLKMLWFMLQEKLLSRSLWLVNYLIFPGPLFPHLYHGNKNSCSNDLTVNQRENETRYVKGLWKL